MVGFNIDTSPQSSGTKTESRMILEVRSAALSVKRFEIVVDPFTLCSFSPQMGC